MFRSPAVTMEAGVVTVEIEEPFTGRDSKMRGVAILALRVRRVVPRRQKMASLTELRGAVVHHEKIPEGIVMGVMAGRAMQFIASREDQRCRQTRDGSKLGVRQ